MSSFTSTHSFQVLLFHLLHLASTFLQADTQSSTLLCSRCPNHLNLPRLTTSAALCTPRTEDCTNPYRASYPSATPHTSISPSSVLSSLEFADLLSSSSRFQSHMSIHSGVWTQALYNSPFMQYDAPRAVRTGDNSLNLAQAHLTLALALGHDFPSKPLLQ